MAKKTKTKTWTEKKAIKRFSDLVTYFTIPDQLRSSKHDIEG